MKETKKLLTYVSSNKANKSNTSDFDLIRINRLLKACQDVKTLENRQLDVNRKLIMDYNLKPLKALDPSISKHPVLIERNLALKKSPKTKKTYIPKPVSLATENELYKIDNPCNYKGSPIINFRCRELEFGEDSTYDFTKHGIKKYKKLLTERRKVNGFYLPRSNRPYKMVDYDMEMLKTIKLKSVEDCKSFDALCDVLMHEPFRGSICQLDQHKTKNKAILKHVSLAYIKLWRKSITAKCEYSNVYIPFGERAQVLRGLEV